jgi:hypothetical protein
MPGHSGGCHDIVPTQLRKAYAAKMKAVLLSATVRCGGQVWVGEVRRVYMKLCGGLTNGVNLELCNEWGSENFPI